MNTSNKKLIGSNGDEFNSCRELERFIKVSHQLISRNLKNKGYFDYGGVRFKIKVDNYPNKKEEKNEEFEAFKQYKSVKALPFEIYNLKSREQLKGERYAVALFSDAHIEEVVKSSSVLGLNEYDIDIAKERIKNYFINLAECIKADNVKELIFASLGDTISGYIHDELAQSNALSPLEATMLAQSLIFSGMKYICDACKLSSIKFIGIVGNHSRTTKKMQHSNGYKLSYEWMMYKNIEQFCKTANLPIEFILPEAELAIVNTTDGKRFIFCHGYQIKSTGTGTVCGIYPALNRLSLKWGKTIQQDKIYLGHFHQCVSISNAVVNGSIIGYNAYSLSNGFSYEEPAQMYEVYDNKIGQLLTRKIYCK